MATAKKATAKAAPTGLTAYCMKTKQQEEMLNAVIKQNGNRFIAYGETAEGHKMTRIMSAVQAQAAIDSDQATLEETQPTAKKSVAKKK